METFLIIKLDATEFEWDNEKGEGNHLGGWNENPEIEFESEKKAKDWIKENVLCEGSEITDINGYDAMVWDTNDKEIEKITHWELTIEKHVVTDIKLSGFKNMDD